MEALLLILLIGFCVCFFVRHPLISLKYIFYTLTFLVLGYIVVITSILLHAIRSKYMSDFLRDVIKNAGNEYAAIVDDGVEAGDVDSFIDTGSYIFNGLLSGSIYGGLPSNKITAIAGESATGKTYFLMGIVKNFLDANPDAGVIYFESESAITRNMVVDRGIDPKRMVIFPVTTVQEFRTQAIRVIDDYMAQNESDRKPLFLCLDSLGMLSTTKEVEDTTDGKETGI